MCVGFSKVQSDDPQSPDSLCNTFTEAGGEKIQHLPHFNSSDYTALSSYSILIGRISLERRCPGLACHQSSSGNFQSLLLPLPPFTAADSLEMLLLPLTLHAEPETKEKHQHSSPPVPPPPKNVYMPFKKDTKVDSHLTYRE